MLSFTLDTLIKFEISSIYYREHTFSYTSSEIIFKKSYLIERHNYNLQAASSATINVDQINTCTCGVLPNKMALSYIEFDTTTMNIMHKHFYDFTFGFIVSCLHIAYLNNDMVVVFF